MSFKEALSCMLSAVRQVSLVYHRMHIFPAPSLVKTGFQRIASLNLRLHLLVHFRRLQELSRQVQKHFLKKRQNAGSLFDW